MIIRLTENNDKVFSALKESPALRQARERVLEAGCSVFPKNAHGACVLVPLTDKLVSEIGLRLSTKHIVALRSDKPNIEEALRQEVPYKSRPKLKDDHRAEALEEDGHVQDPGHASAASSAIDDVQVLPPQVLQQIALLHPHIQELRGYCVSEPSIQVQSEPCCTSSTLKNPRNFH